MNIIEAAEAARAEGGKVIRLSYALTRWSPSVMDVLSDDWEVFRPEKFAIGPQELKPDLSGPLYRLPVKSQDFRDALRTALDSEIYFVADDLTDMQTQGVHIPIKTRLKAVLKEIDRREKGRKA